MQQINDISVIKGRLQQLREKMKKSGVDWYLIPTADFHNSEYVSEYFKAREFFSGFTGSNGTLVVSKDTAGLWTDGRYFIQAEQELNGTGIVLYRMGEEGVKTILAFLEDTIEKNQTVAVDGRVITAAYGQKLEHVVSEKQAFLCYDKDFAEDIWKKRPALPHTQVKILTEAIAGETVMEKLTKVRQEMKTLGATSHVLSKLDDIMWLFNIRANDVACNPVALSYAIIEQEQVLLFLQKEAMHADLITYATQNQITLCAYQDFFSVLKKRAGSKVLFDDKSISYAIYCNLEKETGIVSENPTTRLKAIKNKTEQQNMRAVYLQDSVAVTKFIYWVKQIVKEKTISEVDAAAYLDALRAKLPGFLELSFPTISAYMENAAMMHYEATKEHCSLLKPEGTLLVDSGGQYMGGTTDVTRTIVLGAITEQEKQQFTYVCMGMLRLLNARFLYGCTGRNLDILAREPLWQIAMDYKCGTGHGIGYILNVHEGPQNIRWRYVPEVQETILEEGMVISNEPGVYLEHTYGIRIENIMLCRKGIKNQDGQFMYFEPLTLVPIDIEAIDVNLLNESDRKQVNAYHEKVYQEIAPHLEERERTWLKSVTKAL